MIFFSIAGFFTYYMKARDLVGTGILTANIGYVSVSFSTGSYISHISNRIPYFCPYFSSDYRYSHFLMSSSPIRISCPCINIRFRV